MNSSAGVGSGFHRSDGCLIMKTTSCSTASSNKIFGFHCFDWENHSGKNYLLCVEGLQYTCYLHLITLKVRLKLQLVVADPNVQEALKFSTLLRSSRNVLVGYETSSDFPSARGLNNDWMFPLHLYSVPLKVGNINLFHSDCDCHILYILCFILFQLLINAIWGLHWVKCVEHFFFMVAPFHEIEILSKSCASFYTH